MMQAIRQIAQTPSSHEIRLALPREIPDNAPIEIIILVADDPDLFQRKIQQLRMAMRDQLFLNDLHEVAADFAAIDAQGWDA